MRAAPRSIRRLAVLLIPLAAFSTFPEIQWCTRTWAEVGPECFVECAVASSTTCRTSDPVCGESASCDGLPWEQSPSGEEADRAWCPGDARPSSLPERDLHATFKPLPSAVGAIVVEPDAGLRPVAACVAESEAIPRASPPRARPPVRAPPHS